MSLLDEAFVLTVGLGGSVEGTRYCTITDCSLRPNASHPDTPVLAALLDMPMLDQTILRLPRDTSSLPQVQSGTRPHNQTCPACSRPFLTAGQEALLSAAARPRGPAQYQPLVLVLLSGL